MDQPLTFDDVPPAQGNQKVAQAQALTFDDVPASGQQGGGVMDTLAQGARALRSGLPFGDRAVAGMKTLYNGQDYDTNLANERSADKQLFQDHPLAANFGKGTGALAVPVGSIMSIPSKASLLVKALIGAGTGGVIGGVQGASDTPDLTNIPDTMKHVAQGTLGGTLVGGTLPVLARGIGTGYNSLANLVSDGQAMRAAGVSSAAASHVLPAFQADGPQAVGQALQKFGGDGMLADAGPALLGKAQGASLNSDDARSVLANALTARNQGANGRIQGTVDSALGPAPASAQSVSDKILARRTAQDDIAYPRALDNAPPVDTGDVLATVGQKLNEAVPGTMEHKALSNMKSMLMGEKEVPVLDQVTGAPALDHLGQPVTKTVPDPRDSARQLHKVKQEIDNIVHYDAPGLGVPAGALKNQQGALKLIRGQLNGALEDQVPGYAEANAASQQMAKQAEAVPLGTSLLDSGKTALTPADLAAKVQTMSPEERTAMAQGLRHEIERNLDTKANDLVAGKNVIKGEGDWNRDRLATVFGQGPTDRVINMLDNEAKFRDTHNKVVEGSQTAQRSAAANSMKPQPAGDPLPLVTSSMTIPGLLAAGAKKIGGAAINSMRGDPTAAYGDVAKILSAQGPQRDAYVSALVQALANRQQNAATGAKVGDRAALAAALAGNAYLRNRQQPQ